MKKKTLIIPVVAAMLAVSCGDSPAPAKDWSKEIKDFMTAELGEVLPYLDLDKESLVYDFASDEFGGQFYAYDDNETNLVEAYGEKLVSQSGFTFDEETEAYYKQTSVSTVQVILEYYPATATYAAGNEIDINYMFNVQPADTWSEDVQAKMQATFGTGIVFPYAFIDKGDTFRYGKSTEMNFYMFGTVDSDKCITYLTRLSAFGFEIYMDEDHSYYALGQIGDNVVRCDVYYIDEEEAAIYGYDSPLNEIDFTILSAKLDHFPAVETKAAFDYRVKEEVPFPDLESSVEGLYYVYEEDYTVSSSYKELACDTYAFGLTSADLSNYASKLIGEGWMLMYYDGIDYMLFYPETSAICYILDYNEVPGEEEEEPVREGEVEPGEGEEEEEEESYTAAISFTSYFQDNGDFENADVALSLAFLLGIDPETIVEPEEGDTTYTISFSMEADINLLNSALGATVQYSGYYFFNKDLSKVEYEDPEAEEKVVKAYKYYYLTDGWTEDNNGQQIYTVVEKDAEVAGKVNVTIEISGVPVEKIWTMASVFEALQADEDASTYIHYGPYDKTSYMFSVGLFYPQYEELIKSWIVDDIANVLKGFTTNQEDWIASELPDGTPYEYYLFVWTSKDGSLRVAFEIQAYYDADNEAFRIDLVCYNVAVNPEEPEEPAEPEQPAEPEAE